ALADVGEVFLERDPECFLDVEIMGLADEADDLRAGIQDARQHLVIRRRTPGAFRHPEGRETRMAKCRRPFEEGGIGRVRPRPAALDVIDPETVKGAGDLRLVLGREIHPLRLLPVAQGGVVEIESLAVHSSASSRGANLALIMASSITPPTTRG